MVVNGEMFTFRFMHSKTVKRHKTLYFRAFLGLFYLLLSFTFSYTPYIFGRSFEFISGFLLGTFINKFDTKFKYFTATGVFMTLSLWLLMFLLRGDEITSINTISGKIINNFFLPIFGIIPLIIGLVKEKTILSRFLELNFIEYLGKSSYTFYIIHLGIVSEFLFKFSDSSVIVYLILLLLSCIIFKIIEEPSNKILKKILN